MVLSKNIFSSQQKEIICCKSMQLYLSEGAKKVNYPEYELPF